MTDDNSKGLSAVDLLRKARKTLQEAKEMSFFESIERKIEGIDIKLKEVEKDAVQLSRKKKKVPFEKTKFGMIVKELEIRHGIDDWEATKRARAILKLPKKAHKKLNKIDREILVEFETP